MYEDNFGAHLETQQSSMMPFSTVYSTFAFYTVNKAVMLCVFTLACRAIVSPLIYSLGMQCLAFCFSVCHCVSSTKCFVKSALWDAECSTATVKLPNLYGHVSKGLA